MTAPSRYAIRAALLQLAEASEQMTRCLQLDADDAAINSAAVALDQASANVDSIARSLLRGKRAQERAMGLAVRQDSRELASLLSANESGQR